MLYNMYFSPTGGTRRVADILAEGLGGAAVGVDLCDHKRDFCLLSPNREDVCLVSVPSFGGRVPAPAAVRLRTMNGSGAAAIPVVVYGNRAYDDTLLELEDILLERGFRCPAAVAALAEHSVNRAIAAGRPDSSDRVALLDFARQLRVRLSDLPAETVSVPGKRPYRSFGGSPLKPVGDEGCIACGLCARECPAGAIPEDRPREVDPALCISCMRCVEICPVGARSVDREAHRGISARLAEKCTRRLDNELFL